ncbi:hypothetical protein BGZ65_005090, partial [Modicella reniformis]
TEYQLRTKEDELMIKSGQASILKDTLDTERREHAELKERVRTTDAEHRGEKTALEEKHRMALENVNMSHQFEVIQRILIFVVFGHMSRPTTTAAPPSSTQVFGHMSQSTSIAAPPSSTQVFGNIAHPPTSTAATPSSTQLPGHWTSPIPAPHPKGFEGFASTQSSVKLQPRNDGFSIHGFAAAPGSPRKSRSVSINNTTPEKPRPFQITVEPFKTAWQLDGLGSDIPTHSEEEIIRDKLLGGYENNYGLRNLLVMEADKERVSPLTGSQEYHKNIRLEQLAVACRVALSNLMVVINTTSKLEALKTTTDLLRISLILREPHHTLDAFHILTTLYSTYEEDMSQTICRGPIPFLENERENPLKVTPSESSLPSALACIHYLFLTRIAVPRPTSTGPAFPAMRKERKLSPDAEDHLDALVFQLMSLIATRQVASYKHLVRSWFAPLIRRRIYDDMLRMHLEQKQYQMLDRILGVLEIVTREIECSRLFIGWSVSQGKWTESFSQVDTFSDLIGIQVKDFFDITNGVIPQLKIRVFEILNRLLRINADQTKAIVFKTSLLKTIIYSIRSLVELAATVHYHRTKASVWQEKDLHNHGNGNGSGSGSSGTKINTSTTVTSTSSMVAITPKIEPMGPSSGNTNLPDIFSASRNNSFWGGGEVLQSTIPLTATSSSTATASTTASAGAGAGAATGSLLPSRLKGSSLFSSFQDPMTRRVLHRPSSVNTPMTKITNDIGAGSRKVLALMSKYNKVFDYAPVLRMAMEFVLRMLRSVVDYSKHLREKEPIEYRILAYAMSKVVVWDLGLATLAQELANDVLSELVFDEDEEEYFLSLVKDMDRNP